MSPITNIEILRFHRIAYAHAHSANNYTYSLFTAGSEPDADGVTNGVIEIGYVEENPLILIDERGGRAAASEGDIFILPPKRHFEISTERPGLHRHVTTEALIDCRLTADSASPLTLCLPLVIAGSTQTERIISAIRHIANRSAALRADSYFSQCADYMALLAALKAFTEGARRTELPPSHRLYCAQAEQYAIDNLERPITVAEIAGHIGISKNYLTNIFSSYKGMPLREYINRLKLNHMLELMLRFDYGVREAGEYIGIYNVNYISRMFRRYYGVTLSEYRRSML